MSLGALVALYRALDDIRRNLLRAVKDEVLAQKLRNLRCDLWIMILEDLLNYIVTVLVVDKLIQLRQGHVDQSSLDGGGRLTQDFLDHTTTVFVCRD